MRLCAMLMATSFVLPVLAQESGIGKQIVAPATKSEKPEPILPFAATEKLLPNGLKIIIVPTGFPNLISLQIPVKTGSRNEIEPGKSGFAHFFEHMMGRGTKAYPPEKYQDIMSRTGSRQYAYTADDLTNYHMTFFKEDLETILKLEADRFQHLWYSMDTFKTESGALLGEFNKNSADPIRRLKGEIREVAFKRHPYQHMPAGFLKDIEDLPNQFEYSKLFYDRWYRPEHTSIILAGDVDPGQAIALIEKYWGQWQPGKETVKIPVEPSANGPVYKAVEWSGAALPYLAISFHSPAFSDTDKDFAALQMLFSLTAGDTSALYQKLQKQEQKVDLLATSLPANVDPGLFMVIARVKKTEDMVYVRDAILSKMASARQNRVSEKQLADAKSALKYSLIRSLDNTEQIADSLVRFAHFQRSYATFNQYYQLIDSLTPADLQSAAQKYLTDEGMVVTGMAKTALPKDMSDLPKLSAMAATEVKPVAVQANGKPEMLVQKSKLPQILFKLLFKAGSANDPEGKEGLAALTASMVYSAGSREHKLEEISQVLAPLSASFTAQTDKEMTSFTGTVHKKKWNEFIALALPQLLDPGFREDDFKRLKEAQKNALLIELKTGNDEELAKEELQNRVYAGTPYGHAILGTLKGLEAITIDDVKQFWKQAYACGALRVGIAGDVDDAMLASLQQALDHLPPGPGLPAVVEPRLPVNRGMNVEIVEKNNRATAISMGMPITVTRSHPDFAALWLAKTWLGEHRSSLAYLTKRIREERGMNYGDYAYIEAFPGGMFQFFPDANRARKAQMFEIWLRPVAPENAHMALRITITELEKMISQGIGKEDFELVRDYLMKNVFMMMATQDLQLGYAMDAQWFQTAEFTSMMRSQLSKLTVDEVNAAIKRHLHTEQLSVVMIARDGEDLKKRLLEDGVSTISYITEKPAALLEEDRQIGQRKLNLPASAVTIMPVNKVFAE